MSKSVRSGSSRSSERYHPWTTSINAREEARRRGDRRLGTEHLVLALLMEPGLAQAVGCDVETARGVLESMDRHALEALGIGAELDAPPIPARASLATTRPTIKQMLRDRLGMTPAAKSVLKEVAKPLRRGHQIAASDVLLAVLELEQPDPGAVLLDALGVDRAAVRERLTARADAA
jgi:Clp amino terminal domain, pathogenicity island component